MTVFPSQIGNLKWKPLWRISIVIGDARVAAEGDGLNGKKERQNKKKGSLSLIRVLPLYQVLLTKPQSDNVSQGVTRAVAPNLDRRPSETASKFRPPLLAPPFCRIFVG